MTYTKKIIIISLLTSQALILSIIERTIPVPIPIPGIKLGLANVMSLFSILLLGFKETLLLIFLRVILNSIFGGGFASFFYSISGGLLSAIIMSLIYNKFKSTFSIISISSIGGMFHNIGQIIIASIFISDIKIFYYLPILMISGIITGIITGIIVSYSIIPIKKILKLNAT